MFTLKTKRSALRKLAKTGNSQKKLQTKLHKKPLKKRQANNCPNSVESYSAQQKSGDCPTPKLRHRPINPTSHFQAKERALAFTSPNKFIIPVFALDLTVESLNLLPNTCLAGVLWWT
jgi:SOS response regulatory protein OraA/RecX